MNLTGSFAPAQLRELGLQRLVLRMRRVEVGERGGDVRGVGELSQNVSRIHGLRRIGDVGRGARRINAAVLGVAGIGQERRGHPQVGIGELVRDQCCS